MDLDRMVRVIESLEPVELKGVELLREFRSHSLAWLPPEGEKYNRVDIIAATVELAQYGEDCRKACRLLLDVDPIPLDEPVLEFGI